jgi:hypothetical protein
MFYRRSSREMVPGQALLEKGFILNPGMNFLEVFVHNRGNVTEMERETRFRSIGQRDKTLVGGINSHRNIRLMNRLRQ